MGEQSIAAIAFVDTEQNDSKAFKIFCNKHFNEVISAIGNMKLSNGERIRDIEKFIEENTESKRGIKEIDDYDLSRCFPIITKDATDACMKKCARLCGAGKSDIDPKNPKLKGLFNYINGESFVEYKSLSDKTAVLIQIGKNTKYNDRFFVDYIHIKGDIGLVKELVANESTSIFDECVFI